MAKDIGAQVKLTGEQEYKDALNQIDKQLIALKGDYKALNSSLDGYSSAMESNRAKHAQLNTQIEAQNEKLKLLKEQLEKVKNAEGDHTAEEARLRSNIGYTTQEVKKLRDAYMEIPNALETVGSKMQTVGSKMSSIGSTLTASVTTPIVGLAAYAYKSASDLEENINKVDVAFGTSADTVKKWAKTATDSYGLSESKALEATALFGDMATSMGMSDDAAASMSTSLTGLAGDLASFKNISQDQAMNALQGIFTGQTKALKGLGIVMTDTNLKDFAEKQGLVYDKMSETEKVTLRYNFVLSRTQNAQGDYVRTASGAANSMRTMQASLSNLADTFGEKLLPTFTPQINKLTELIKKFASLSDGEQQSIIKTLAFAAAVGPVLIVTGELAKRVGFLTEKTGLFVKALTSGQTVAQSFTAIGLNPMALAITATVAAFAGMTIAAKSMQDEWLKEINSNYGLTDSMKGTIETVNSLKDSMAQAQEASAKNDAAVESEYGHYNSLVQEYNNLIDANGQVKAGYENRANYILTTLSSAMGMEDGQIQTLIDDNGKLSSSIDEVILKKKAEAVQNAYQDQYTQAVQNQAEATKALLAAKTNYYEALSRYSSAESNYNSLLSQQQYYLDNNIPLTTEFNDELNKATVEYGTASGSLQQMRDAYDNANTAITDINTTISNYEGVGAAIVSGDADQINQAIFNMTNNFKTAQTANADTLAQQTADLKSTWEEMKKAVDEGSTTITQKQVDAAHEAFLKSAEEHSKAVQNSYDTGYDSAEEMAQGLSDGEPDSTAAADTVSSNAKDALTKDATSEGQGLAGSYAEGISDMDSEASNAGTSLGNNARDGAGSVDSSDLGNNFAIGFGNGISSQNDNIWSKAWNLAQIAWNSVSHALDEHSPSKKTTKQGVYFGEGLANGILSQKDNVQKAAESLSNVAMTSVGKATIPLNVAGGGTNTSYNTITLQVYGTEGQSINDLTDQVMNRLQTAINKKGSVWE